MSTARLFNLPDEDWEILPRLKQKSLAQRTLARATVVGHRLRAMQSSKAAYPFIRLALEAGPASRWHSGRDGERIGRR